MTINDEILRKSDEVRLLKLEAEETRLHDVLVHDPPTDAEYWRNRIDELKLDIRRLEADNCEFRDKVVGLHTDIQEKGTHIKELEDDMSNAVWALQVALRLSSASLLKVAKEISEWINRDSTSHDAVVKIKGLIEEYASSIDKHVPSKHPAAVMDTIAAMEKSLSEGLPDGVSVEVIACPVSQKQMSELLNIANED